MAKRKTRSDKGKKRGPYGPRTYQARTNGMMLVEAAVRQVIVHGGIVQIKHPQGEGDATHTFAFPVRQHGA